MTKTTGKTQPKGAAPRKKATAEAVSDALATPEKVDPMHPEAYRLAISIVNSADIKGGDAETIVLLKRELSRVSGHTEGQPRS